MIRQIAKPGHPSSRFKVKGFAYPAHLCSKRKRERGKKECLETTQMMTSLLLVITTATTNVVVDLILFA